MVSSSSSYSFCLGVKPSTWKAKLKRSCIEGYIYATLDELDLGWLAPSHGHMPDTSCNIHSEVN